MRRLKRSIVKNLFTIFFSKCLNDWQFRLMDFILHEKEYDYRLHYVR